MSSETSPTETAKPPRGGIGGIIRNSWRALLVVMNACFWNTYELLTPHKKFDVQKAVRRPRDNVVITGGARGIGKEIVRKLLMLDMNVIIGVRSENAAKAMIEEFRKEKLTTGTVDIMTLDLKSFASVREFASKILEKYSELHVLINNAGIYDLPYEITEDGFEITFQVNYLSHFLLTNMLLPKLTNAGTPEKAARIVHVSSIAHYPGKLDVNDLWMEFVKEGYPVRSYAVHPGCVASGLYNAYPAIIRGTFRLMFKTNEQGADVILYTALSPDVESDGGKYFQNCAKFGPNSQVTNAAVQQKLLEASCKATGWEDSLTENKPTGSPSSKKAAPSIVITKENGSDSSGSKMSKDDSGKNGENGDNAVNKIDVKITEQKNGSRGDGDAAPDVPPSVGGSE